MSKLTFFDINSTYRDRNRNPSPSEFEIPISQTGIKNKSQAFDGISLQSGNKYWNFQYFNSSTPSRILEGTVITDREDPGNDFNSLTRGLEAIVLFDTTSDVHYNRKLLL